MQGLSQAEKEYRKMTETSVARLVTSLSVPTVISMLITSIYNMADTYFVSQLGTSASGATGIVFPMMAIIQAIGFTIGMGSGTTISRLLGRKKYNEADEIASSGFVSSLAFGVIIGLFGIIFLDPLMKLLGTTPTILPFARDYAFYILLASPVMATSFVLNNLLRAEGKARFAMIGIMIGGILNIGLDPLLIFTFDMGIRGAAIATALSQLVSFSILLSNFVVGKTTVHLKLSAIAHQAAPYLTILKNGMPSLCRQGLASISTVALNTSAAVYGDPAVAAMSIVGKIFMMVFSVLIGFGQGYQPVVGYNYSSKHFDRVKKACYFMLVVGTITMTLLGAIVFIFAPELMGLFIKDDPAVIEIGSFALRLYCVTLPFTTFGVTCNMTLQSVGKSGIATFVSACRQGVFFLPLILVLPRLFHLTGVQITQPVSDICTFLVSIPFMVFFLKGLKKEK